MFCLGNCGGGVWFDQSLKSKATIENAQIYQLGMKLARLSNSSKEVKEDFHSKAKTAWNFLTKTTGILDPKTFQVILAKLQKEKKRFSYHKAILHFQSFFLLPCIIYRVESGLVMV